MAPPPASQNAVDLGRVGIAHQGRLVRAAPQRGEPRPLQMDSVEQAGANVVGQCRDLTQQVVGPGGDQGRDECGGAVPAVKRDSGGRVAVFSRREVRPSPAVQMGVDEAGRYRRATKIAIRGSRRGPGAQRGHSIVGNLNPCGPQQFSTGQQGVGGHQHGAGSDALPFRLRVIGLAVVVHELKPTGGGVVEQHRDMRVVLQDRRGP